HHAFDALRELLAEAAALDGFTPENPQISRYQTALYEDLEEQRGLIAADLRVVRGEAIEQPLSDRAVRGSRGTRRRDRGGPRLGGSHGGPARDRHHRRGR